MPSRRVLTTAAATAAASVVALAPTVAGAHGDGHRDGRAGHPAHLRLPETIALPPGFQPEGIEARGRWFYAGSRATGQIVRGNVTTGTVRELVAAQPDAPAALGLRLDRRGRLFVSGGGTGTVSVYDARSGAMLYRQTPAAAPSFINDVAILRDKAVFTDSAQARLVVVPIGKDGALGDATTVPITGSLVYDGDPATLEANGIVRARDGRSVIVVSSRTGELHKIDPATGVSTAIPVTGGPLTNGDGLLRRGRVLLAVQNRLNRIAVMTLSKGDTAATVRTTLTDPDFDVPTTLAIAKRALVTVNARFSSPPTPDTAYDVVRVDGK
jgi:sugar lactone lactonase YvrE